MIAFRAFAFRNSVMGKGIIMEVIERMKPRMCITKVLFLKCAVHRKNLQGYKLILVVIVTRFT